MAALEDLLKGVEGFEWDEGNADKNWRRHEVRQIEAEQALMSTPVVVTVSTTHGAGEPRFVALGATGAGRLLTVVFTIRQSRVRVVSARPMSRAERRIYGQVEAEAGADVHK